MSTCRKCQKTIVFAVVSNRDGRPPSRMPLDPVPSEDGNVAVYRDAAGGLVGRVLGKGEKAAGYQRLFMPHFATCKPQDVAEPASLPPGVTSLAKWRKAASGHAAARRNRRGRGRRPGPPISGIRIDPGRQS